MTARAHKPQKRVAKRFGYQRNKNTGQSKKPFFYKNSTTGTKSGECNPGRPPSARRRYGFRYLLITSTFDCVLLGHITPYIDNMAFLRALNKYGVNTPILQLSTENNDDELKEADFFTVIHPEKEDMNRLKTLLNALRFSGIAEARQVEHV